MRQLAGYIVLSLFGHAAFAQPPVTIPRCATPPAIDGRLDEPCWSSAAVLDGFVQTRPGDNAPPSRDTTVRVAYDAQALYLGIRAADDPARVRATVARRDAVLDDDHVLLYLDTFDDRRRAYVLAFNPLGIQQDGIYIEGREVDYSVDVVMQSKGSVTADGYVVEVALPWSSIRYRAGEGRRWGVHVQRRIRHLDEEDSWQPLVRGQAGFLAQAGAIGGLDDLPAVRTVEIIPGVTVSESGARREAAGGRFVSEEIETDPSLTVKLAPTPNLVLDATVNPDFAQIESDELVSTANQRFPIFFAEKRPFFLEGIEVFRTPLEAVHSRTIVDPDFAAKVSGKRGRTTFAALAASDNAPGDLSAEERDDPALARFAGRNAAAGALRLKRDVGSESYLGLLVTSYDFVERHGRLGGIDGRLALDSSTVLTFQLLGTWSERGFYDPEHDRDEYREGSGLGFFAEWKRSGRHFNLTLRGDGRSPDYRADLGFTAQTDLHRWSADLRYDSEPRSGAPLLSWSLANTVLSQWDWEGRAKYGYVYPRLTLNFRRQTEASLYVYADYLRLFEEEFGPRRSVTQRGAFFGEPERSTVYKGVVLALQSKPIKQLSLALSIDRSWDSFDYDFGAAPRFPRVSPAALADPAAPLDPGTGDGLFIIASLGLQPSDALRLTFDYTRSRLVRNDTERVAFDEHLYSTQVLYQLTSFVFARARVDYASLPSKVRGQLVLGWTPSPGTALYVGYSDDLTREHGLLRNSRTVFVKSSYRLRKDWLAGR